MEAMITLEKREDNIQQTDITENVIQLLVNNLAQLQPIWIPIENPVIRKHLIVRDGHSSPHDVVEYHSFTFSAPNSQGEIPVRKIKDPLVVEIFEKHRVLEERLKAKEGNDVFDLDALDMCLVPYVIIPTKFKTLDFEKYKGLVV